MKTMATVQMSHGPQVSGQVGAAERSGRESVRREADPSNTGF